MPPAGAHSGDKGQSVQDAARARGAKEPSQHRRCPAHPLLSAIRPPELRENRFLLFLGPRKLVQALCFVCSKQQSVGKEDKEGGW